MCNLHELRFSRLRALVLAGLLLLSGAIQAQSISGPVIGVIDGDTLDILHNGRPARIRLQGINTPEKGEAFSQKAKQSLSDLAYRRTATVHLNGATTHDRLVGIVSVDGLDVNLEQVRRGLAWYCANYLPNNAEYRQVEAKVRSSGMGIHGSELVRPGWCIQAH